MLTLYRDLSSIGYAVRMRNLILILVALALPAWADTITVLDAEHQQHKIRLQGIDAPEKKQPLNSDRSSTCLIWCSASL